MHRALCIVLVTLLHVADSVSMLNENLPNILIMLADDVGYGDIGCFGNTTLPTPNIDRIAREGVKLTQHLATSGMCTPSRSSFLTSRYAVRMGMVPIYNRFRINLFTSSTGGLDPREVTFAELLKKRNYSTAFIGKWHLGLHASNKQDFRKSPTNQGFDYFYGLPLTNLKEFGVSGETVMLAANSYSEIMILAVLFGTFLISLINKNVIGVFWSILLALPLFLSTLYFWVAFDNLPRLSGMVLRNQEVIEQPVDLSTITQRLVKEGKVFLEERTHDQQPFLLYMSWLQVHTALHASGKFQGKSAHGAYGDEVMMLDWTVGEMLDALDLYGFTNNTIVYFSTDQGGHTEEKGLNGRVEGGFNGIFKGGKAMGGWEGGIRVPTVMRWPGVIPSGSIVDVSTSQMDIMPTIAAAVGIPMPDDRIIDGANILPLLKQEDTKLVPHEFLFHYCGNSMHAARWTPRDGSGDVWKVHFITPKWIPGTQRCFYLCQCYGKHVTIHEPPLLYNVAIDPGENTLCNENETHACGTRTYQEVLSVIKQAAVEFSNSLEDVESQFTVFNYVPRPWLQPCCNFPYCTCKEER